MNLQKTGLDRILGPVLIAITLEHLWNHWYASKFGSCRNRASKFSISKIGLKCLLSGGHWVACHILAYTLSSENHQRSPIQCGRSSHVVFSSASTRKSIYAEDSGINHNQFLCISLIVEAARWVSKASRAPAKVELHIRSHLLQGVYFNNFWITRKCRYVVHVYIRSETHNRWSIFFTHSSNNWQPINAT